MSAHFLKNIITTTVTYEDFMAHFERHDMASTLAIYFLCHFIHGLRPSSD